MAFPPDSARVIYNNNPLAQVICQVRFPPVLRIMADTPVGFQEAIRHQYPLFEEVWPRAEIPPDVLRQLPEELVRILPGNSTERSAYTFASVDKKWTITLARDFIALTTLDYQRWEVFRENFHLAFGALVKEYSPALFTRVGLRYQDVIDRGALDLGNVPWPSLLRPEIAGLLAAAEIEDGRVQATQQVAELAFPECGGKVKLRHGFSENENKEMCYLIDNDFFAEQIKESNDVMGRLDCFNSVAGRLFRWCITDRLHEAMEPQPI